MENVKLYQQLTYKEPNIVVTPIIDALRKLRQENYKFRTSLGYIVKLCLKLDPPPSLFK